MSMSVGTIDLDLDVNQSSFNKKLNNLGSNAESSVTSAFSGLGSKIGSVLGALAISGFVKSCLDAGSDLQEVQNVVDNTFKSMSGQIEAFSKNAMTEFGLSETMAKNYSSILGSMSESMGFTEAQAYDMATAITGLTGDVASFFNLNQDEAFTKLKAIWTGETEAIKDLGVVMTQAALDQYALNNGFGKTTANMTEQEKVMLRYQYVMSSLSNVQGDFARTSGSWANQVRILKLRFDSLRASLGKVFIAVLTPVIRVLNTLLAKINTVAEAFANFIAMITGSEVSSGSTGTSTSAIADNISGLSDAGDSAAQATDSLSDATGKAGDTAAETAKKIQNALMGFDKINKLNDNSDDSSDSGTDGTGGAGGGGIGSSGSPYALNVDTQDTENKIAKLSDLMQKLKGLFDECKAAFMDGFEIGLGDSLQNIEKIKNSIRGIGETIYDIFTDDRVQQHAHDWLISMSNALGKEAGSMVSVGITIATNILGGLNQSLAENKERIINYLCDMFDISARAEQIKANFMVAMADVFSVLANDDAINITSNLISIFSVAFMDMTELAAEYGTDILDAFLTPITTNSKKIKLSLESIVSSLSTVSEGLKDSTTGILDNLLSTYKAKVSPVISNIRDSFTKLFGKILDLYNQYFKPVIDMAAKEISSLLTEHIQPFAKNAIDAFSEIAEVVGALWTNWLEPIWELIYSMVLPTVASVLSGCVTLVSDALGTIFDVLGDLLEMLSGILEFLAGVFSGDWEKAWSGIQKIGASALKAIKDTFSGVGTFFKDVFLTAVDNIKTVFNVAGISSFFKSVYNGIKNQFSGAKSFFKSTFSTALSNVKSAFSVSKAKQHFSNVYSGIKSVFSKTASYFKTTFSNAWEAVKKVFSSGGKIFSGIKAGIEKTFKNIVNTLISGINTIITTPFKHINSMLNRIRSVSVMGMQPFSGLWGPNPISVPKIPKLATGGYVKANTPQLAMIGDNPHQGEVVAPEDKLIELISKYSGGRNDAEIVRLLQIIANKDLELDGNKITKTVVKNINATTRSTNNCPILI